MNKPEKPSCFITSVGTSLIENSELSFTDIFMNTDASMEDFLEICNLDSQFEKNNLENYAEDVNNNEKFSAEIDSLKGILKENDRLILLPSKTARSYFCARVLKCHFTQFSNPILIDDQVEIIIVEGLREPDDKEFGKRGLPDFLNTVVQNIQDHYDQYKIVMNPTGGYKSLFPLMTIAGIIYELDVIYIYEKTDLKIKIPPLPLHVNLPAWTQMESLIGLFDGKSDFEHNKIYERTKDQFGLILYESINKIQTSAIVKAFAEHADLERGKPELTVRTENSPLISFLTDEQKEIFIRLTQIGHLIWKGDRVPEMADHALKHHSDLFHLAERVLLPLFYYNEEFLEPHELFVLLCALHLHDCGHVIDRIQLKNGANLPLFPLEIRDHHHVLGYLRLKYPEIKSYMGDLITDHLCATSESENKRQAKWKNAWDDYLHAVAVSGLYHRKKMFLDIETTYKFYDNYEINEEDKNFPCLRQYLQKNTICVFNDKIKFPRMKLIVSLLRIIDSLDEQARRTGTIADIKFHLAQLKVDANTEKNRCKKIGSLIQNNTKQNLDAILSQYLNGFRTKEEKGFQNKKDKTIEKTEDFRKKIEDLAQSLGNQSFIIDEYVNSYLKGFFKEFQIKPYGEKAFIKDIIIRHKRDEENKKTIIIVDLEIDNETERLKAFKKLFQITDPEEHRKMMLKSIQKEYKNQEKETPNKEDGKPVVKDTLDFWGVEFKYGNLS